MSQAQLDSQIGRWSETLLAQGYCVIPNLLPRETVADLDRDLAGDFAATPFCRGGWLGDNADPRP